MASVFTPGTSGTLKSTNIPAAFYEMAMVLSDAEKAVAEAFRPDQIQIATNSEAGQITVAANVPIASVLSGTGAWTVSATDYLAALVTAGNAPAGTQTFTNGTGGEVPVTSKVAAFWAIAQKLHAAELAKPADTRPNNITISADFENGNGTIAVTLPMTTAIDATGKIVVTAVDYL